MFCHNCGTEIKGDQKFCNKCGVKINTNIATGDNQKSNKSNNFKMLLIFLLSFIIGLILIGGLICIIHIFINPNIKIDKDSTKQEQIDNSTSQELIEEKPKTPQTPAEKLYLIDEYQAKYFTIVRRNDVLLKLQQDSAYERDMNELSELFKEVKNRITDTYYLNKYNEIEERFASNPGENTVDMNIFASQHYDAVDDLLNEVYQAVKTKIPAEDFKNLINSEVKWLKDVESYKKVYESKGFGTIGALIYYDYEVNMRNFRTLLLMLYL